jgi:hypothetical protein
MTEDRLRADQTARTGQDPVGSRSRRRLAAIVVVGRDVATLAALDRELSRRYRADYRIVVCGRNPGGRQSRADRVIWGFCDTPMAGG